MAGFDWATLERDLTTALVRAVTSVLAEHPGERFYAAALWLLYRESDGPIRLPLLAANTVAAIERTPADDRDDLRWSPADWEHDIIDWLPGDDWRRWEHDLTAHACRGTPAQWEAAFRRYVTALVTVCRRARRELGRDLLVVIIDPELHETVIPRLLAAPEVRQHFPELDEQAAAWGALAALSPAGRAAHLAGLLNTVDGPITGEAADRALRDLGPAAIPALIPLLEVPGTAWRAAKILAGIGRSDDDVITALTAALARTSGPDRSWVAAALSRLGRLDTVLAATLPTDVVVTATAAPYGSFRDETATPPPLDYTSLTRVLREHPHLTDGLAAELTGTCEIRAGEVDEAVRGTGSAHPVVRRHAVNALGEPRLGRAVGRRVLPLLARLALDDPDAVVRRLAVVGLSFWGELATPHLDVARAAARDPDPTVRRAAAAWLLDATSP
ncbi:DUF4303 domain-containing protein [Actinoplanes philippinensis]|uniref:DUF4303 domain-containing protein n=1 Tax=Actinoplanes philippinensis TaxID=35752 RepID=UPI000B8A0F7F|nr:DUF4303 domain-containing protein [Actinoplanes philippinensis]